VSFFAPKTKSFYKGIELYVGSFFLWIHHVQMEKGTYFTGRKIARSTFRKGKRFGFGFSFFEHSLLFQFGKMKLEDINEGRKRCLSTKKMEKKGENSMKISYESHNWLTRFYHFMLLSTKNFNFAKEYLSERGISDEMIKKFQLGYSPRNSNFILEFLGKKGFKRNDLLNRKVISLSRNGNYYDPFFNRIVFPIHDFEGRVCGFGGRTMDKDSKVKYLNTPETRVFKKSENLYGFHLAKESIREQGYAVLFEGYFDVIQAHQYGLTNSVASLGTALTPEQAMLLKSVTNNVIIIFDDDDAGIEASFRSASVLEQIGCNALISNVGGGLDPDEWFRKHQDKDRFVNEVVNQGINRKSFFIKKKLETVDKNNPSSRFSIVNDVLGELPLMDVRERSEWLNIINQELNVPTKNIYKRIS